MEFAGKHVVVTGAARGIGAALADRFCAEGARLSLIDLEMGNVPTPQGAQRINCDVGDEAQLCAALEEAQTAMGPVDIYVSNAGVLGMDEDHAASAGNACWTRCWQVNVMAHVFAARALLPAMLARGSGHFVTVASAAGLLNQIGDAAYSATKQAAVSFAESLAIRHGDEGIGVTLVCPQYVATHMIGLSDKDAAGSDALLTAGEVAQAVISAMKEGRFLVLPHREVREFAMLRAQDHDRWIGGMRKLQSRARDRFGKVRPEDFYKLL